MFRYIGVLLVLLTAGCATTAPPQPQIAPTEPAAPQAAAPQPASSEPAPSTPVAVEAATPAAAPIAPAPAASKPVTRAAAVPPTVKAPAPKTAAPAAPRAAPPISTAAAAPTLDVDGLKARLKATKAIGVFTKLSLKGKVDDLMQQFTNHYQGKNPPIAELRQSYDLLMMKVLTLLQDGDAPLASAVVSSREAIWALLANEKTFAALQS